MTFDQLITMANVQSVLLCEISAAVPLQDWVPYNDVWRCAVHSAVTLTSLSADGVAVTQGADIAAVEATPGRWVQSGGFVYYNPAMGEPYAEAVVGVAAFYFSDLPKAFDNPYESRLKSAPNLSLRIEPTFGGVAQIGGGKISFHNEDGFFDSLSTVVRWDNGVAVIKLGLDRPGDEMDYADFQTVGTWNLEGADFSDSSFDLTVRERKGNLKVKIPTEKFTRDDYPPISNDVEDKIIPTIYGRRYGVPAYLIDPSTLTLKVASHAVFGFLGLRKLESRTRTEEKTPGWVYVPGTNYYRAGFNGEIISIVCNGTTLAKVSTEAQVDATASTFTQRDNFVYLRPPASTTPTSANTTIETSVDFDAWVSIPFETRDKASGEFTVSSNDWDGEADLIVDVIGKTDDNGDAMENVADIIADILATLGETNLNTDSFDAVRSYFDLGTTLWHGEPIIHLKPSLWLGKEEEALKILERINSLCGTYLYVNALGQWSLGVAQPESETVLDLTTVELFAISGEQRTEDIFTSVEVKYAQQSNGYYRTLTESDERARLFAGKDVHVVKQVEAELWDEKDARYMAQRVLSTQGQPLRLYKAVIPRMGLTLEPGNKVKVNRTRGGLDELMEVIEVSYDLLNKQATLLLGDMRGWGRSCGFWTGSGQADWDSGWTDTEAKDNAAQAGFWTDDNGYADAADARSRNVSRWW